MNRDAGDLDLNCGNAKFAVHPLADVAGHTVAYRLGVQWSASAGATWVQYKVDSGTWVNAVGAGNVDGFASCKGGNLDAGARIGGVAGSFLAVGVYRGARNAGQGLADCDFQHGNVQGCKTTNTTTHVTASCWHMESSRAALTRWRC